MRALNVGAELGVAGLVNNIRKQKLGARLGAQAEGSSSWTGSMSTMNEVPISRASYKPNHVDQSTNGYSGVDRPQILNPSPRGHYDPAPGAWGGSGDMMPDLNVGSGGKIGVSQLSSPVSPQSYGAQTGIGQGSVPNSYTGNVAPIGPHPAPSPPSNRGFGLMGAMGMVGIGAGVGALTASGTGGNSGPGAMWGGLIGGGMGIMSPRGMVSSISRSAQNIPFAGAHMSEGNLRRASTVGSAALAGYGLSGNRGDDKRRGFNAKRGNKISSSKY